MNDLISWLGQIPTFSRKFVILPNKNFHFELRKALAAAEQLNLLFNCELLTPTGFVHQKLYELDGSKVVGLLDLMYSFQVCLEKDLFGELEYFDKAQIKDGTGYAECFARSIIELDQNGFRPSDLLQHKRREVSNEPRVKDLAQIWQKINEIALSDKVLSYTQAMDKLKQLKLENIYWLKADDSYSVLDKISALFDKKTLNAPRPSIEFEIEDWASAEEEEKATLYWIIENLQRGCELSDLAIVSSGPNPRMISYINYYLGGDFVYSPRGGEEFGVGVRANINRVLKAIEENLPAKLMPRIFCQLIVDPKSFQSAEKAQYAGIKNGFYPMTEEDWIEIINTTGSVGGNRANSSGITDWSERIYEYWPRIYAFKPSITKLVELTRLVNENQSLDLIAPVFSAFLRDHHYFSPKDKPFMDLFFAELAEYQKRSWAKDVKGERCLSFISSLLFDTSSACGKLGENKIFYGTLEQALGLKFKSLRLVGLQEGSFPRLPKQDAIIPDEYREQISSHLATTLTKIEQVKTKFNILLSTISENLTLSTYSQNIDGSEKSYSGLILDMLDNLGHSEKLKDQFAKKVTERKQKIAELKKRNPYLGFLKLEIIKRKPEEKHQKIPEGMLPLSDALSRKIEGWANKKYAGIEIDKEQVFSPSQVGTLLTCPQKYLYEQILGFNDMDEVLELGGLDPMSRGTMIHWMIEQIDRDMGFVTLGKMPQAEKDQVISRVINQCLREFPIVNFFGSEEALAQEVEGFENILEQVILRDTELNLVETQPEKKIEFNLGELKFKGKVDRIEKRANGKFRIVDFKSGRGFNKNRENNPFEPGYDVQLVLYLKGILDSQLLKSSDIEALEFRYPESDDLDSREFAKDDLGTLMKIGKKWFDFILHAHEEQYYPMNPSDDNCYYCAFSEICEKKHPDIFDTPAAQLFYEIAQLEESEDE